MIDGAYSDSNKQKKGYPNTEPSSENKFAELVVE